MGWCIDSKGKNEVGKETRSSCWLESRVNEAKNMVEGNRVRLRAGRVVSEGRNVVEGNRVQLRVESVDSTD